MSERRRRARVDKEWDLSLYLPRERHREDGAHAFDLSSTGFGLRTRLKVAAGERIQFHLQIPGGAQVSGMARIAWSYDLRGRRIAGAEILGISRRDALRLRLAVHPQGPQYRRVARNTLAGLAGGSALLALQSLMSGGGRSWDWSAAAPYLGAAGMALTVLLFLYFRLGDSSV